MYSIIVKDGFYNSSIVQSLRLLYPKNFQFIRSTELIADLIFPFCSNLSFSIFYPDHLNEDGVKKAQAISQKHPNFVVVICISADESLQYEKFLCAIPQNIKTVVCFPHDNFQKSASSFIFNTVNTFKKHTREIEKMLEQKRKDDLSPDFQAKIIFSNLIKPTDVKNQLLSMMTEETGTIRKTMIEGLPELFKCDFYMESEDSD